MADMNDHTNEWESYLKVLLGLTKSSKPKEDISQIHPPIEFKKEWEISKGNFIPACLTPIFKGSKSFFHINQCSLCKGYFPLINRFTCCNELICTTCFIKNFELKTDILKTAKDNDHIIMPDDMVKREIAIHEKQFWKCPKCCKNIHFYDQKYFFRNNPDLGSMDYLSTNVNVYNSNYNFYLIQPNYTQVPMSLPHQHYKSHDNNSPNNDLDLEKISHIYETYNFPFDPKIKSTFLEQLMNFGHKIYTLEEVEQLMATNQ